jgi:hypothetical protein
VKQFYDDFAAAVADASTSSEVTAALQGFLADAPAGLAEAATSVEEYESANC